MSKTALYCISLVLAGLVVWLVFFHIPSLTRVHIEENEGLKAQNKTMDSMLMAKQFRIDSLDARVIAQEARFQTILADTNKVHEKHKAIFIRHASLSVDSAKRAYEARYH